MDERHSRDHLACLLENARQPAQTVDEVLRRLRACCPEGARVAEAHQRLIAALDAMSLQRFGTRAGGRRLRR